MLAPMIWLRKLSTSSVTIGPSQSVLSTWEKRCHRYDFGRLFGAGVVAYERQGDLLLVIEREAVVGWFLEAEVF